MMTLSEVGLVRLQNELQRVTRRGELFDVSGQQVEGATESDTIQHLTSRRYYVPGRQFRFPGIANGWVFEGEIKRAGFKIVDAVNRRGQRCRVVVSAS